MKEFSSVTAMIKNADGEYEGIPALRGVDSYELAVKNGYKGTEEEWLESIIGDGWIGAYQELDAKTDEIIDEVNDFKQLIEDTKNYQKPWNVDDNVGSITANPFNDTMIFDSDETTSHTKSWYMINSGEIYFSADLACEFQNGAVFDASIDVLVNDVVVHTEAFNRTNHPKSIESLLNVEKGDVVTIRFSAKMNVGSLTLNVNNGAFKANIETPYTYVGMDKDITSSVIDALLGVNE